MVHKMFRLEDVVSIRLYPLLIFILVSTIDLSCIQAAGQPDQELMLDQRQLGCVWRPKNASLFCLLFDHNSNNNSTSNNKTGGWKILRRQRGTTKFLDLECFEEENDLKKITQTQVKLAKSDSNNLVDDYLDDEDDRISETSRDFWTQLEFVRVRGCPLHQVAVNININNNNKPFVNPLLRGSDFKSDDFFADFFQPTVGGRIDWSRIRGLDLSSSGLNRPLSSRTRTFCELSESLTSLHLSSNFYASVIDIFGSASKAGDKCPFSKLSSLNVANNQISTLASTELTFAPNLESLDLSSNRLERIEVGSLRHLTSLKTLHLSDNQLSSLIPTPWANLTQLRELYLQGNKVERLPDFVGLGHLVVLNLSRNAIATIDDNSFADLGDLVALDLSHNRIVGVSDEAFSGLKSLQVLTLAQNRIQTITANPFAQLTTLHALLLSHNVIDHVHQNAFANLSDLRTLSLDRNRIKSLHRDVFEKCSSLRDLNLAANLFRHFPQAALKPSGSTLQTLDFGENLLQLIHPTALSGLSRLYGLRLAGNKLRNLTENVFEGVENLKMLNLASNLLQNISKKAFSALKELKALRLDDNQLEDINGLLMSQHHLQWLNVSHNQLQWFDYAFIPKSVLWLSLRSNQIEELANYYEMRTGFHLVHLDVGENRLLRLDRQSMQSTIQEFYADRNLITELAANTFSDLANLTKINLTGNRLDKFPLNALALQLDNGADVTAELFLRGNPLKCDCEMEWLQRINSLANSSPREFPRIGDWSEVTCSLNNRHEAGSNLIGTNSTTSGPSLIVPVSTVQASEFICQYATHCYALCMCCDFFACDCRMKCSDGCDCYHDTTWSANIIHCGKRNHADIPKFIPMDATSIYLDGNRLGSLTGDEFIGRKHLTSLYLNSSGIAGVSNKTFKGLTELLALHLDHNLIGNFSGGEFEELTALQELHLNDNRLTWIAEETFYPLKNLRILRLENNRITIFPIWSTIRSLPLIRQITLAGNPWSCQCDFVQKLQHAVSETRPDTVPDFSHLQCVSGSLTSDIGKFNLSCADVLAVSFRSGDSILADVMPILAVVAASVVIVVSLIILAVAIRKPFSLWLHKKYGVRINKSHPTGMTSNGGLFIYDCLIHASPVDEEFVRQTIVTRLEAAKRSPYRMCVYRHGTRTEDLRSGIDCSASVVVVASDSYVQHPKTQAELSSIADICNDDGKRGKTLLVIAMDAVTAKSVRRLLPAVKASNVLVWGTSDFWQKLMFKLPDPSCHSESLNVDVGTGGSDVDVVKKYDDEMWTYLKGAKVESSLLEPSSSSVVGTGSSKDNFSGPLQNSFSGPSGDSSLSTQSTDNSGGTLSYGNKKRSATLNHSKTSPKAKSEMHTGEIPSATTMLGGGRRSRDPQPTSWETSNRRRTTTASRKSDARVFENPLDKFDPGDRHAASMMLASDSDYMSVNDSLLRPDHRRNHGNGNNNEPIYHTLEDDDDLEQAIDRRTISLGSSMTASAAKKDPNDSTVYINADLEVVYPPLPLARRDFVSDDDDDAEFEHLLRGGSVTQQRHTFENNGDTDDCDEYENDDDRDDLFQRHNSYVPSPAPGSFPRRWIAPSSSSNATPKASRVFQPSDQTSQSSYTPRLTQGRNKSSLPSPAKQHLEHYRQQHQQQQQQQHQQQRRGSQQQHQQFDGYLI